MKKFIPLIVSLCIAITLTIFVVQMENEQDPVPASYDRFQDIPAMILLTLIFTAFVYGFFLLANRGIAYLKKYKSHELTSFL